MGNFASSNKAVLEQVSSIGRRLKHLPEYIKLIQACVQRIPLNEPQGNIIPPQV